jgi:hypothetical protein
MLILRCMATTAVPIGKVDLDEAFFKFKIEFIRFMIGAMAAQTVLIVALIELLR